MAGYGMPNDDEGAAFGVYPQMARRRESSNDREASKDVPLQAARGMLAGTLGMPGDLEEMARAGARQLGVNVGASPALPTSDAMRETLPVPASSPAGRVAGAVGATVGMPAGGGLGMKAVQEAAPVVRRMAATALENARHPQPLNRASRHQMGAIVFHGSPHTFEKFDAAKIGTGEGNQVFGHGLYVAEHPEVADSYRRTLTDIRGGPVGIDPYGSMINNYRKHTSVEDVMAGKRELIENMQRQLAADPGDKYLPGMLKHEQEKLAGLSDIGSLYKIDLADKAIPHMLDLDKTMGQQLHVLEGLRMSPQEALDLVRNSLGTGGRNDLHGRAFLDALSWDNPGVLFQPSAAAQRLREAGVPGTRYLDRGSRGMGAIQRSDASVGSSNFVVFPGEEGLLKILERNGRPIE